MNFREHFVPRGQHRIYAREYAGAEPVVILMHGFPDNLHLYDRLVPFLLPSRRVVTFDFLGWGSSDKPLGYPYTAANHEGELDTVVKELNLGHVVLNTYYCAMPTLRPPEAIFLFSTLLVRSIARPISGMFGHLIFRRMYWWQIGRDGYLLDSGDYNRLRSQERANPNMLRLPE